NALLVNGDDDAGSDLVVSGSARAKLSQDTAPAGTMLGAVELGAGLGLLMAGGIFAAVNQPCDREKYSNCDSPDIQSSHDSMATLSQGALVGGAVLTGAGVVTMLIDSSAVR